MHENNELAHLDIKPDNFVINEDYTVSMIDFGFVNQKDAVLKLGLGTKGYIGPEIKKCINHPGKYSYNAGKADMYALGVLIHCLVIWENYKHGEIADNEHFEKLIRRLTRPDPTKRPSIK